jgi:purine-nucleoside phosphorylase
VLTFTGRHHYYESRDVELVAHAVRTAAAAGCRAVVLTSASGGIRDDLAPGDLVLLSDHINLTGASPLVGGNFVDLTDLYSARLRALARELDPSMREGVYAGYWGPNYETPAEIRAYKTMGADIVGMSTVLEAIAAHAQGMDVLAVSLVTNRAAGLGGRLDHAEVLSTAAASVERMRALFEKLLPKL